MSRFLTSTSAPRVASELRLPRAREPCCAADVDVLTLRLTLCSDSPSLGVVAVRSVAVVAACHACVKGGMMGTTTSRPLQPTGHLSTPGTVALASCRFGSSLSAGRGFVRFICALTLRAAGTESVQGAWY